MRLRHEREMSDWEQRRRAYSNCVAALLACRDRSPNGTILFTPEARSALATVDLVASPQVAAVARQMLGHKHLCPMHMDQLCSQARDYLRDTPPTL